MREGIELLRYHLLVLRFGGARLSQLHIRFNTSQRTLHPIREAWASSLASLAFRVAFRGGNRSSQSQAKISDPAFRDELGRSPYS